MGAVADAMKGAAAGFGAEVRTEAPVAHVVVRNGRATGVVLENGDEITAPLIVTTLHPTKAFLEQIDHRELPEDFVRDIERWKTRSGVVKINLALSELPDFLADPGSHLQEHHTGSVEMAPSVEFIERAFVDAREGRPVAAPFSDSVIPTTFDKTLSPEGTHIMSFFSQWVPADWSSEPYVEELEAYCGLIDLYDEVAPNFKRSVMHRDKSAPMSWSTSTGSSAATSSTVSSRSSSCSTCAPPRGNADYRTPVAGLYYGSSATHAGGGVCGIPGWQAARAALSDQRAADRRSRARRDPAPEVRRRRR